MKLVWVVVKMSKSKSRMVRINPALKREIDSKFPKFRSFSDRVETLYDNYVEMESINKKLTKANNLLWGKKITKNVWGK